MIISSVRNVLRNVPRGLIRCLMRGVLCGFGYLIFAQLISVGIANASVNARVNANSNIMPGSGSDYLPHLYLAGFTGNDSYAEGDALVPVMALNDRLLFAYFSGTIDRSHHKNFSFNRSTWIASFGGGYRQIYRSDRIFGASVLFNRAKSINGQLFWVVEPGVETLGRVWDAHIHAYLPLDRRVLITENWADQLGLPDHIFHTGHVQYDDWYKIYEHLGTGVSASVGRTIFGNKNIKAFVGGYYFHVKDAKDIVGLDVHATWQITPHFSIIAKDFYDNKLHNVFDVGLRISLFPQDNDDLHNRLFDRLEEDYGSLVYGGGDIVRVHAVNEGHIACQPEFVNIQYVIDPGEDVHAGGVGGIGGPGGSAGAGAGAGGGMAAGGASNGVEGSGTFEDPYIGFNQEVVDDAFHDWSDPTQPEVFYLKGGEDVNYDIGEGEGGPYPLKLHNRQYIIGRQRGASGEEAEDPFFEVASGANRPMMHGALELFGDNHINAVKLHNGGEFTNEEENGGASNNGGAGTEAYGIWVQAQAARVELNNVEVTVDNGENSSVDFVDGVLAENHSDVTVRNSIIDATSDGGGADHTGNAIGIHVESGENVDNGGVGASAAGGGSAAGPVAGGAKGAGQAAGPVAGGSAGSGAKGAGERAGAAGQEAAKTAGQVAGENAEPKHLVASRINVVGSEISGIGSGSGVGSGSGYGVLVGNAYYFVDGGGDPVELSVSGHHVFVKDSTLGGEGDNDAAGLLVGNGAIDIDVSGVPNGQNVGVFVKNNDVKLEGNDVFNATAGRHAYGVLVGNGSGAIDTSASTDDSSENAVAGNTTMEVENNVEGNETTDLDITSDGGTSAFGVLVGNGIFDINASAVHGGSGNADGGDADIATNSEVRELVGFADTTAPSNFDLLIGSAFDASDVNVSAASFGGTATPGSKSVVDTSVDEGNDIQ